MPWDKTSAGYIKAVKEFRASNPLKMAIQSKSTYDNKTKNFTVKFLNDDFQVSYPNGEILHFDDIYDVPKIGMNILLLHYLTMSKDIPLSGELISFKGVPNNVSYLKAFLDRAVNPISKVFSSNPKGFKKALLSLNGKEVGYGDIAFTVNVLPRIPLTYVLWLTDEELNGSANILFDSSVSSHLPTEDITALGEITTSHIIHSQQM
jgi:hypothetical protein